MKKFENLGKKLSKEEQKKIKGGNFDPGTNPCSGLCESDSDCLNADCVCGIRPNDPVAKCYWLN